MSLMILRSRTGCAQVETRGGAMASWMEDGFGEILAMARKADIGRLDVKVQGGIPLCWPWAAYEGAPGCRIHGLARYREWSVVSASDESLVLALDDSAETCAEWPHRFHLELCYRLSDGLTVEFKAMNVGDRPFSCTELFHPYFRVGDFRRCRVTGTDGARYFWRQEADAGDRRIWRGDFDCGRLANGAPGYVFEPTTHRYRLSDPSLGRELTIDYGGNRKMVIWGAGGDFSPYGGSDDPLFGERFLCVEGGTLYRDVAYVLEPGEIHNLKMNVSIRKMEMGILKQETGK